MSYSEPSPNLQSTSPNSAHLFLTRARRAGERLTLPLAIPTIVGVLGFIAWEKTTLEISRRQAEKEKRSISAQVGKGLSPEEAGEKLREIEDRVGAEPPSGHNVGENPSGAANDRTAP